MSSRYRVWLDAMPLHAIDPDIIVTDIMEAQAETNTHTAPRANGHGMIVTKRTRESLSLSVHFVIWERDTLRRKDVLRKIIAWAKNGKYLSISDRPGQRLRVELDSIPVIDSSLHWTQSLAITFVAYASPFWEDEEPAQVRVSSEENTSTFTIMPAGDGDECTMDVVFSDAGMPVTIKTPLSSITFGASGNGELVIKHDNGIFSATVDGISVLSSRTPESSDNLLLIPGQANEVTITTNGAHWCEAETRGRWV